MFARVTLLRIGPGRRVLAEQLSQMVGAVFAAETGYRDAVFLVDVSGGEWGCVSYWDTREQAGEVRTALAGVLQDLLEQAKTLEREPRERIMEVLDGSGGAG